MVFFSLEYNSLYINYEYNESKENDRYKSTFRRDLYNMIYDHPNMNRSDVSQLILAINTLGENLVGLELGVGRGESFITILNNCNIKKLYGVDSWMPYVDWIKSHPDGKPHDSVTMEQQEIQRFLTYHSIKHSKHRHKAEIIEKDTLEAAKQIPDESLDFVFFDVSMTAEKCYEDVKAYYPKMKKGGLWTGHDSFAKEQIIKPIEKVKKEYNNNNEIVCFNRCFLFRV